MAEFDRLRVQQKRVLHRLHDSAVRLGSSPGAALRGVASSAAPALSSAFDAQSEADEDGYTVESEMLFDAADWDGALWT